MDLCEEVLAISCAPNMSPANPHDSPTGTTSRKRKRITSPDSFRKKTHHQSTFESLPRDIATQYHYSHESYSAVPRAPLFSALHYPEEEFEMNEYEDSEKQQRESYSLGNLSWQQADDQRRQHIHDKSPPPSQGNPPIQQHPYTSHQLALSNANHSTTNTTTAEHPPQSPPSGESPQTPLRHPRRLSLHSPKYNPARHVFDFELSSPQPEHQIDEDLSTIGDLSEFLEYYRQFTQSDAFQHTLLSQHTTLNPQYITGTLLDFQLDGLNWMTRLYFHFKQNNINGGFILADEMGLGKTIQVIAFLSWYRAHFEAVNMKRNEPTDTLPILVVAPLSTLHNWCEEMHSWSKNLSVLLYSGSTDDRYDLHRQYIKTQLIDVIVTSYDVVMHDFFLFRKYAYSFIVCDEAHRLKNPNAKIVQSIRQLNSHGRIFITGTPLSNNVKELFALMSLILPSIFSNTNRFTSWFGRNYLNPAHLSKQEAKRLIETLHEIIRPFLLRRVKSEVNFKIPPNQECIIYVDMEREQKRLYNRMIEEGTQHMDSEHKERAFTTLMQMRKLCNHPFLVNPFTPQEGQSIEQVQKSYIVTSRRNCGKFRVLIRMLKKLKKQGHKVIIFSLMTKFLDIFETYLKYDTKYTYRRLDGNCTQQQRQKSISDFSDPDANVFCFLISTMAGGMGITLTAADTVIIYDSDWNPQNDLQAMARTSRIGQTKLTHVYRLITRNCVESHILSVATRKLDLERMVIRSGSFVANVSKAEPTRATKPKQSLNHDLLARVFLRARRQMIDNTGCIDRKNLKWLLDYNHEQARAFDIDPSGFKLPKVPLDLEKQLEMGFEFVERDEDE